MADVTVLMTVFNGMPYLPAALESVLGQTFQNFEFIIVNDGSTDGTVAYLENIQDPRIRLIHQENGGTADAANHGLQFVNTEFVIRMDADDVSLPTRFEKQLQFLRNNPKVNLVGTQIAPLGERGVGETLQLPTSHEAIFSTMMAGKHGLAHSAIMMRTEPLKSIGGYWKFRLVDDWDMMLRMGEIGELANVDEVLHHYRVHEKSLNGSGMRRMRFSIDYACELARRRQNGQESLSPEAFKAELDKRSIWKRWAESLEIHARCQYRLAVAEMHGKRKLIGLFRMGWAACCSPTLTLQRLLRMFHYSKEKSQHV